MTQSNPTPPPVTPPFPPTNSPTPVAPPPFAFNFGTGPGGTYLGPPPTADDKNLATLLYVLAIFTGFLGPLIIWLVKKDESPFLNDQGKEVLNFEITRTIAVMCCVPLFFVLIGIVLMPVILIGSIVFLVLGALQVKDGVPYQFPIALRLVK